MGQADGELLVIADELYGLDLGEFIAARDGAARAAGDKDLGKAVKALRKPSLAAWAVNLLVRREHDQLDQVLALGEALRAAAETLDGDELRQLTRQRRQLTTVLATAARELARDEGVRLTEPVVDQVAGVLTAAMLDPVAAEVVRSGMVLTAFTSTGVSEVDVDVVCAIPEAVTDGHRAPPVEAPQPGPPTLTVIHNEELEREQALEAAREELEQASLRLAEVAQDVEEMDASRARLRAKRLQLGQEVDELQRRIAMLTDELDRLDADLEDVDAAIDEAEAERDVAQRAREAAQRALDSLG